MAQVRDGLTSLAEQLVDLLGALDPSFSPLLVPGEADIGFMDEERRKRYPNKVAPGTVSPQ